LEKTANPKSPHSRSIGFFQDDFSPSEIASIVKDDIRILETKLLNESKLSLVPFETTFLQSETISSSLSKLRSEKSNKSANAEAEFSVLSTKLINLKTRRTSLLSELEECEKEITIISHSAEVAKKNILELDAHYQKQIDPLVHSSESVKQSLKTHDGLNLLLSTVSNFESIVLQSFLKSKENGSKIVSKPLASTNISSALVFSAMKERWAVLCDSVRSYIFSDVDCLTILVNRILVANEQIAKLDIEMNAFKELFLLV
jgi:hypothetical protein